FRARWRDAMAGQSYAPAVDADNIGVAAGDTPEKDSAEPKDNSADWPQLHEKALKTFRLCDERESENRKNYVDDVRFGRLGGKEQWPQQIITQREAEGKPCLTTNMMPSFIHQVINDSRQNKPAIQVHPV